MDRRLVIAAALSLLPAAASAAGGEERKKGGGAGFVQIKAIVATIVRRDGSRGVITVECGLDTSDDKVRQRATASEPRLRAAYAGFVQAYAAGLPTAGVPDADYLARELQRLTDQTLGQKGAKFLLGTILIN